jgi:hypothetical protein
MQVGQVPDLPSPKHRCFMKRREPPQGPIKNINEGSL